MEYATLTPNLTVKLPADVLKHFKPSDRFVVVTDGDTLILKRVMQSVTEVVDKADAGEPMSLDEVDEIVHQVRRTAHNKTR